MPVTISIQTVITIVAFIGAILALWGYITKIVHKLDYDAEQDVRISEIEQRHDQAIEDLRRHHDEDMLTMRGEMAIICRGILASLKDDENAKESSIKEMEDYLNNSAHGVPMPKRKR